jgi:hypothetical protein
MNFVGFFPCVFPEKKVCGEGGLPGLDAKEIFNGACKSFCVNACGINGGRLGGHQIL